VRGGDRNAARPQPKRSAAWRNLKFQISNPNKISNPNLKAQGVGRGLAEEVRGRPSLRRQGVSYANGRDRASRTGADPALTAARTSECGRPSPTGDSLRNPALLAALALGLLLASCAAPGGPSHDEVRSRGHPFPLDSKAAADLGFLLPFAGDARVVLLGEYHGFRETLELAAAIFRFLHERAGFDRLALEVSCTDAASLNEYLETGNEFHLLDTVLFREPSAANSEEFLDFFRALHRFRASLPEGGRFSIWGIDLPENFSTGVRGQVLGRIGLLPEGDVKKALLAAVPRTGPLDEAGVGTLRRILSDPRLRGTPNSAADSLDFFLDALRRSFRVWRGWPVLWFRERDRLMLEFLRRAWEEERDPSGRRVLVLCGARHARKKPVEEGEAVLAHLIGREIGIAEGKIRSVLLQPLDAPPLHADPPIAALAGALQDGEAIFLPLRGAGHPPLLEPGAYPQLLGRGDPVRLPDFYDGVILFSRGTPVRERGHAGR